MEFAEFRNQFRQYRTSRVLHTAVQLRLFDWIGEGATADEIATRADTEIRATGKLLNALVALGVLGKDDEYFIHTDLSRTALSNDGENFRYYGLLHSAQGWDNWSDLPEIVKTGALPEHRRTFDDPGRYRTFILAMHAYQKDEAKDVIRQLNLNPGKYILDCGGGPGTYARAFADLFPESTVTLFDLPEAIQIAKEVQGTDTPLDYRSGDFFVEDLGGPYDLIFLSNIIHSWSPEESLKLFKRLSAVLNPDGQLIVRDRFLNEDRTSPLPATMFSLHMLVSNLEGSCYTVAEVSGWMRKAHLHEIKYNSLSEHAEFVKGRKTLDNGKK